MPDVLDYIKSAEDIHNMFRHRKLVRSPDVERMLAIKQVMENEMMVALPEFGGVEKPSIANLALQGMSQLARRIASVEPSHFFPPLDPSDDESEARARMRRSVMSGWHQDNNMFMMRGKKARQILTYANTHAVVKPNPKTKTPHWSVRNPITTYPSQDGWDCLTPYDVIYEMEFTYYDLLCRWGPEVARSVRKPISWDYHNDRNNYRIKFTVLEYLSPFENSLVLCGSADQTMYEPDINLANAEVIDRVLIPDRVRDYLGEDVCLATNYGSLSLDKQMGFFDGNIGMYQSQAALMSLALIAQRRSVFPREWGESNPNEEMEIIATPDPYQGQPGEIKGGRIVQQNLDPSFRALEVMDRLTHEQRQQAALPSEFGGMSQSDNVRTGRRGQQVMGAAIDFTIAEVQDIMAAGQREENMRAIAIDCTWYNRKKTYFIASRSFTGQVEYKPTETWERAKHIVDYPIAGTDLQNLPIEGGQRVAMRAMSLKTFMNIDPMIKDPDQELNNIQREGIGVAFLSSIQTHAASGDPAAPWNPETLALLDEKLASGMELYVAVKELQREMQERQATPAPDLASQMPGLSVQGSGETAMQPTIPDEDRSMGNMAGLLGALGTTQQAQKYRGGNG